MVNLNHSTPLFGVKRGLGAFLRTPDGEMVTTHDRADAQRWADQLNAIALYEWRLEEIRQYFAAWEEGELPAHRALEGINDTLAADPFAK